MSDREIVFQSGTGKVLRKGDICKVKGLRGDWTVLGRDDSPTLGPCLDVRGGPNGMIRTVVVDRVTVNRRATNDKYA